MEKIHLAWKIFIVHGVIPTLFKCTDFIEWHGRQISFENPLATLVTPLTWISRLVLQVALPYFIKLILISHHASQLEKLKAIKHLLPPPNRYHDIILEDTHKIRKQMRLIFHYMPTEYLRNLDRAILKSRRKELPHPSLNFSKKFRNKHPTSITVTAAMQEVFRHHSIEWPRKARYIGQGYFEALRRAHKLKETAKGNGDHSR
ncbi:MAG: hypothetical protein KBC64_00290 [Simkaniaceae bacterium]|nr:hypothetical protein [Simkaniaceae bacterium]